MIVKTLEQLDEELKDVSAYTISERAASARRTAKRLDAIVTEIGRTARELHAEAEALSAVAEGRFSRREGIRLARAEKEPR